MNTCVKSAKLYLALTAFALLAYTGSMAQNEVAIGSASTKSNAILWLNGNGSQGLILPVVTNRNAVSNPDKGMIVYDDSDGKLYYRNSDLWIEAGGGGGTSTNGLRLSINGNNLSLFAGNQELSAVPLADGTQASGSFLVFQGGAWKYGTLSGDVTGTASTTQVVAIKGRPVANLPSTLQALVYDPAANSGNGGWAFQSVAGGGTVSSVSGTAPITVNNGTTTPTISISNGGISNAFLADNSVSSAKIQDGTVTSADIASSSITADKLAQSGATNKDVLTWDGTKWTPTPVNSGAGTITSITTGTGLTGGTITTSGTVAVDVGSTAGKIVQLDANAKLPAVDGSLLTNINASNVISGTLPLTRITPGTNGQVLTTAGGVPVWGTATSGTVTSVTAGTGLTGGTITGTGTVAVDVGTTAGKIVQLDVNGKLPAVDGSALSNLNAGNIFGTLLPARIAQASATTGQVLKWDGSTWAPGPDNTGAGTVPTLTDGQILIGDGTSNSATALNGDAVLSGAKLTINPISGGSGGKIVDASITSADLADGAVSGGTAGILADNSIVNADIASGAGILVSKLAPGTNGQVLTTTGGVAAWGTAASGTVTSVTAGAGLTGGTITSTGTVAVDVGTTANKIVQLDASAKLPAVDGSSLTNLSASNIGSGTLALGRITPGTNGQVLTTTGGVAAWGTAASGTVTSVTAGTGLTGGTITSTGTVAVDVGTTANKIVQLDASAKLPAVDGSLLTNINATSISSGILSLARISQGSATTGQVLKWNGSAWAAAADNAPIVPTLSSGQILIGDGTTNTASALSGDATLSGSTLTINAISGGTGGKITDGSITSSDLAAGSVSGGTAGVITDNTIADADISTSAQIAVNKLAAGSEGQVLLTFNGAPSWGSAVTSITAGTGLTGGTVTNSGTIAVDVGTTAEKIVQLDLNAKLPAVDGSALTNLDAGSITTGSMALDRLTTGNNGDILTVLNGLPSWSAPTTGWGLTGNSGTTEANNFIGTNDDAPLVFKVAGVRSGYIKTAGSTLFGYAAGENNSSDLITAFGRGALQNNTTGFYNTAMGYNALKGNVTGNQNTVIGAEAGSNATGSGITAVGYSALPNNKADANTGIGFLSMQGNTSGAENVGVGALAMFGNITGNRNTALGTQSLFSGTASSYNTGLGWQSLYNTTGSGNTAVGYYTFPYNTTGAFNTVIGYRAGAFSATGNENTAIGSDAFNIGSGSSNTMVGAKADVGTAVTNATAIGYSAVAATSNSLVLGATGPSAVNVGINTSSPTARLHVVGDVKIVDGNQAAGKVLTSDAYGLASWQSPAGNTGWGLTGNSGTNAATSFIGTTDDVPLRIKVNNASSGLITSTGPTLFGYEAGALNINFYTTAFGFQALTANTSGNGNSALGRYALASNTTGNYNTAIGNSVLERSTTTNDNTGVGFGVLQFNTGYSNTGLGSGVLNQNADGYQNTAVGQYAMQNGSTGSLNTAMGSQALKDNAGNNNTAVGSISMAPHLIGNENAAFGYYSLAASTTGSQNTAVGALAMYNTSTAGIENTAFGFRSLEGVTGNFNTGLGTFALSSLTSGTQNVAVGRNAASGVTGSKNTVVGALAGAAVLSTGSQNTLIGYAASVDASISNSTVIGANAQATVSNALILGPSGTNVGIGTTAPTANLEVNGFTKLGGSAAPAIKMAKLTGTTAGNAGGSVSISLGTIPISKILAIDVMVEWATGQYVPPRYNGNGTLLDFTWYSTTNSVVVVLDAGATNILSKPVKILVTYEQ